MDTISIKSATATLRGGDVITKLACRSCSDNLILVLERHQSDCTFDFSLRAPTLNIAKDPRGPFRWNSTGNTFTDKDGRPYEHIDRDTVVIQGAGMKELAWYRRLPKPTEAPFQISLEQLMQSADRAQYAKISALVLRMSELKGDSRQMSNTMQQALAIALGNTEVSEQQMHALMMVLNLYLADVALKMAERTSEDPLADLLDTLLRQVDLSRGANTGLFGQGGTTRNQRGTYPAYSG